MLSKFQIFIGLLVVLVCIGSIPTLAGAATQTIAVSGSVAPQASDFQLAINNDTSGIIPQNTTVTYTITFGSHLLYADTIKLEAQWYESNGAAMDYVAGSADSAYGATPVVDLTNKKIDWTISSLPANTTNQTVTFQLRTNSTYTGTNTVVFPTKVRLFATNFTESDQESDITYQYATTSVTATPTPATATPTLASTIVAATPTPIQSGPTPIPSPFTQVTLLNLSSSTVDIGFITNQQGPVTLLFGNSPTSLSQNQTIQSSGQGAFHIDQLLPEHTYYFQMQQQGFVSEVFSFTTPPVSQIPQVVTSSLVIATNIDVLYSPTLQTNQNITAALQNIPIVAIAPSTTYTLAFTVTKTTGIQSVQVMLESTDVLGAATQQTKNVFYPYIYNAFSKGNGIYIANIANTLPPGNYRVFLVVHDTVGNITTQEVAKMHVLHPFSAFDGKTKKPIADVRIVFYRLSPTGYLPIISPGIQNPLYTTLSGTADQQLVSGKYKAVFSHLGYTSESVFFSVGLSPQDDYPIVFLTPQPITLSGLMHYYQNTVSDYLALTQTYLDALHTSYRFFDLLGLGTICSFMCICFLLFFAKTHLYPFHLPWYLHHHGLLLFGQQSPYLTGRVVDSLSNEPIAQATIFLLTADKKLVKQLVTTSQGNFLFPNTENIRYISVMKEGFSPVEDMLSTPNMLIALSQQTQKASFLHAPLTMLIDFFGLGFEFVLAYTLFLELLLSPTFGIAKTAPFLFLSLCTVLLWFFYVREEKAR